MCTSFLRIRPFDAIYFISKEKGINMSDWKQDVFCPCQDLETCLCGTCCTPCLVYQNAEGLQKPGILWGLLSCFVPCIPIMILRNEARNQYGIEGSVAGDAVCSWCCTACVNCQTGAEIKQRTN